MPAQAPAFASTGEFASTLSDAGKSMLANELVALPAPTRVPALEALPVGESLPAPASLPALSEDDLPAFTLEEVLATVGGWRIEVTRGGKFWQWRRGSGPNRKSRYGGTFSTLSEERQAQYVNNRETKARH